MKKVDNMLKAGCNGASIARSLGMHPETLYNHITAKYKIDFSAYKQQKVEQGNDMLHLAQFNNAIRGNNVMQIWLGKQRLNQTEKIESQAKHELTASDLKTFLDTIDTNDKPAG